MSVFSENRLEKGEMESWRVKMVETPYSDWKGLEELAFPVNTDFSVLLSLSQRLLQALKISNIV